MAETIVPNEKNFLLYKSSDDVIKVKVLLQNETIWLSQKSMWNLFNCTSDNIVVHLKNIYNSWELDKKWTTEDFSVVQKEWNRSIKRTIKYYNLDAIISVWYRVNSIAWTHFRMWATKQLKELIIKWFVLDEEKLKNPQNPFWTDYFELLEEKIADIRTSERRFYQKITDIYTTSIDYDKNWKLTKDFFATVQNKLHFWIHWKTAAELIVDRANSDKKNMWITCIEVDKLKKTDIFIAKNYLTTDEINWLNLIVEQYLAFAKFQAQQKKAMKMEDWILKLDDFLRLNEKEILLHKGNITKKLADSKVERIYEDFRKERMKNYISDFDRLSMQLEK